MIYKADLDRSVSSLLQLPHKKVEATTRAFINALICAIAEEGEVDVRGLGVFRISTVTTEGGLLRRQPMKKRYVRFTKSRKLKRAIEEVKAMEKYGVDESLCSPDFLGKEAREETTCPKCGTRIERHGRILVCPKCGTEPFEE